ncbi:hypothetical protein ERO13_A07G062400v2 [Gossypium hirsutum]|uniref:tRNA uridine(34) hydroxylase N-terminal domain-containing protein n=3 Tax=Gossypium TaxID=3633 RepID=A0A5J5V0B8_GOSBA|nr:hypothetical protein ES319_A07G070100v1 [Gossypium barbadense]KAG4190975.1 hypothetical protein ERO13_A07G062400v2 [Gossypium hirsutum]TYH09157.1 hypothetical protein ES288_A07G073400v1 [Gossypium darwinii]TYJ25747.1 hypothetical protein E1A91_A07G070800v1 [Gossypium mustelinum]KAB2073237.1 hypothetical protein ES319_A07G070100v1 [Gossypium barbadense]
MGGWSVHSVSTPLSLSLGSHSLPKPAYYCCFNYGFPVKSRKAPFCAISIRCCASASKSYNVNKILQAEPEIDDFVVVNFYRFVFIKDPQHEIAKHLTFLKGLDIHGRIYINEQGINAQYSGPSKHSFAYVEWLKEDDRFSDILVQTSPAFNRHAFPKLKLRYKPSLVQLEGGISHLPLLDPSMRAAAIAPSEWRKRLEAVNNNDAASNTNPRTNYILLDATNGILVIFMVLNDQMWIALEALHLEYLQLRVLLQISYYKLIKKKLIF